jgi:hypothetical protein
MARHDIAMTRFAQWWRRSKRAGYAFAEGAARPTSSTWRYGARAIPGILLYGIALPALALGLSWPTRGLSLLLLLLYPLQWLRITRRTRPPGWSPGDRRLYAASCVLAKFPQALGLIRFWLGRLTGRRSRLIEYKTVEPAGSSSPPAP